MAPSFHAAVIGTAISSIIREAGMSQKEFGAAAGIPHTTLSKRINGHIPFTWPEIAKVAEVTGVPIMDIVIRAGEIAERRQAS